MAYASTAPDARAALYTGLAARPALAAVTVLRNLPAKEADLKSGSAHETIYIGRWDTGQDVDGQAVVPHVRGGGLTFDETFTLWVTVQVTKPTTAGTEQTASERAWTLAAEIIGYVASSPDLDLDNTSDRLRCHVDGYSFDESVDRIDSGGSRSRIAIGLTIQGRKNLS